MTVPPRTVVVPKATVVAAAPPLPCPDARRPARGPPPGRAFGVSWPRGIAELSHVLRPSGREGPDAGVRPQPPAAPAPAAPAAPLDLAPIQTPPRGFGRIPVAKVEPVIEGARTRPRRSWAS